MKKIMYSILAIMPFVFISCSTDTVETTTDENTVVKDQSELVLKEIKSLGFSEKDILDMGSYFLVGNDITFSKTGRPQLVDENATPKQRRTTYLVSDKTIGVRIDPSLPSNWKTATRDAMAHWNANSGSSIFLYETDYYWPYNGGFLFNPEIQVMNDNADPLPNNTIAAAEFPTSNGMPGYRVRINLSFNPCTVTNNLRFYNMIHEFGHCLTFAHTNSSFGTHISGTPTSDSNSVMNGGTACTLSSGLSTGDRTAVDTLYPLQINAPTNVQAYHDGDEELTMTWNAVPGATSYKIYNNIKETGKTGWYHYRTRTSNSYSRELKKKYRSGYRMMVTAVDASGNESKMTEANYNW